MLETIAWTLGLGCILLCAGAGAYALGHLTSRFVSRRVLRRRDGWIRVDCPGCWRRHKLPYLGKAKDMKTGQGSSRCKCGLEVTIGMSVSLPIRSLRAQDLWVSPGKDK